MAQGAPREAAAEGGTALGKGEETGKELPASAAAANPDDEVEPPVDGTAIGAAKHAKGAATPEVLDPGDLPGPPPLHPFILEIVQSVGAIVSCNTVLSGGIIGAAILFSDPWHAFFGLLGCTVATAIGQCLRKVDPKFARAGLIGYNGLIISLCFSVFLFGMSFAWKVAACLAGGAASAIIAGMIWKLANPMPPLAWSINLVLLASMFCVRSFENHSGPSNPKMNFISLGWAEWVSGVLNGLSQIFVVRDPLVGLLVLFAAAVHNYRHALALLFGSATGVGTAFLIGADAEEVWDGLWGFNPALTALFAVSAFTPTGRAYQAMLVGGTLASAALFAALKDPCMKYLHSPCLSLPFCMAASGMFLMGGRFPGILRAKLPPVPGNH